MRRSENFLSRATVLSYYVNERETFVRTGDRPLASSCLEAGWRGIEQTRVKELAARSTSRAPEPVGLAVLNWPVPHSS